MEQVIIIHLYSFVIGLLQHAASKDSRRHVNFLYRRRAACNSRHFVTDLARIVEVVKAVQCDRKIHVAGWKIWLQIDRCREIMEC